MDAGFARVAVRAGAVGEGALSEQSSAGVQDGGGPAQRVQVGLGRRAGRVGEIVGQRGAEGGQGADQVLGVGLVGEHLPDHVGDMGSAVLTEAGEALRQQLREEIAA